ARAQPVKRGSGRLLCPPSGRCMADTAGKPGPRPAGAARAVARGATGSLPALTGTPVPPPGGPAQVGFMAALGAIGWALLVLAFALPGFAPPQPAPGGV